MDQVYSQLMGGGLHRHLLLQGLSLPGDLPSSSETYWVTQPSRPGYLCWLIGPEPLWPLLTWRGLELRGKGALGSAEPVLEAECEYIWQNGASLSHTGSGKVPRELQRWVSRYLLCGSCRRSRSDSQHLH